MSKSSTHTLQQELPEYRHQIVTLRASNPRFARMMDVYHDTSETVRRLHDGHGSTLNEYENELKHRRVQLKDQLLSMIVGEGVTRH